MSEVGRIVATGPQRFSHETRSPGLGINWRWLLWLGVAICIVGASDLVLAWIPFEWGNREWEFGTVSRSFESLPLLTLGLGLCLAASAALGRWKAVISLGGVLCGLGIVILAAAALYAVTVPIAVASVEGSPMRTVLHKAVAKTVVQAIVYPLLFFALGISGIRAGTRPRPAR